MFPTRGSAIAYTWLHAEKYIASLDHKPVINGRTNFPFKEPSCPRQIPTGAQKASTNFLSIRVRARQQLPHAASALK